MAHEEQILFSLPLGRMEHIFKGWMKDVIGFNISKLPSSLVPEEQTEFLGIREAAKLLNLSVPSVYTMVHKRQIPFYKRRQKLYFKRSELLEWIEAGRRKTVSEVEADAIHSLDSVDKP